MTVSINNTNAKLSTLNTKKILATWDIIFSIYRLCLYYLMILYFKNTNTENYIEYYIEINSLAYFN